MMGCGGGVETSWTYDMQVVEGNLGREEYLHLG